MRPAWVDIGANRKRLNVSWAEVEQAITAKGK